MDERQKGEWGELRDEAPTAIVDLNDLRAAAEFYGGDLAHWPKARREEAERLLSQGGDVAAEAEALLAAESAFDAQLQQAAFVESGLSMAQLQRFEASAAQARQSFPEQLAYGARDMLWRIADLLGEQISPDRGVRVTLSDFRAGSFGGLGAAAAVAGLVFGLYGPATETTDASRTAAQDTYFYDAESDGEEIDYLFQDLALGQADQETDA